MTGLEVFTALTGGLAGFGIIEGILHRRRLRKIPIRIHVSGTRGKTSVTRLIASGLNEAGITTVAKTTGTLARMVFPDRSEAAIYRPLGPNIIEQKRIVKGANALKAKAIVTECMALQPILHWVLESKLVKATHAVITNARADHLDIMGPTEADVARTLAGMIPIKGTLFTGEVRHIEILDQACKDRGTRLVGLSQQEIDNVADSDLAGFDYVEHRENVALVLKVLEGLGVDRDTAIQGMWKTRPDPGALSEHVIDFFGRRIVFVNGFAANDPESTKKIFKYAQNKHSDVERVVGVFNLRADRPSRTEQLVKETSFWREADRIVLMGTGAYLFMRMAVKMGIEQEFFIQADGERAEDVFEKIIEACGKTTLLVGMGNIGGPGLSLARYFRNRAAPESTS